jgi:hypothetical protein
VWLARIRAAASGAAAESGREESVIGLGRVDVTPEISQFQYVKRKNN